MSTRGGDPTAIIKGLKVHFGVESDEALAAKLGVAKSTIATWRRRGAVPSAAARQLEENYGITFTDIVENSSDEMRDYVLRQAFYYIVLGLYRISIGAERPAEQDAEFAENVALVEPFLKRVIVRAASSERYQGVSGAASFLLDLRAGKLRSEALMAEAVAERRQGLSQ